MNQLSHHPVATPFVVTIDLSATSETELIDFLVAMPRKSDTAFVVIASPSQFAHLTDIRLRLERHTHMSVVEPMNGMTIQPHTVFLMPADQGLVVKDGLFCPVQQSSVGYPSYYSNQGQEERQKNSPEFLNDHSSTVQPQTDGDRHLIEELEKRVCQSDARYRRLYNKAPVMLHTIDAGGTLISVSDYWLRKLGYTRQEVLGRKMGEFLTAASANHVETVLLPQYPELEVCIDVPYQMVCKNGTILDILLSAIAERNASGEFAQLLAVIVDVTELQRTQQALAHRAAALARSNADLEQFAYVVSHDLQEPLRAMTGFSELLQQCYGDQLDATAKTYLQHIGDGGIRMQRLIDGILAFSRISHRQPMVKAVDINIIIKTVMQFLASAIAETRATITYGTLPTLKADYSQMLQLFQNLISNALKFHGSDSPQIHIKAQYQADCWQFSIQDNGIGIPADQQSRIFTLFQQLQTHPNTQGYGIGLAICKKIVERHNGHIWLDSVPNQGTTFHFTLSKTSTATETVTET